MLAVCCMWLLALALPLAADGQAGDASPSVIALAAAPSPLSMNEAVALALEHSPLVRIAEENYNRATGAVTEAKGGARPNLAISGSYIRNDKASEAEFGGGFPGMEGGGKIVTQPLSTKQARATLSQPIDISGLLGASVSAAEYGKVAADAGLQAARQDVALGVRSAYLQVLQARDQQTVSQDSVTRLKEYVRIAQVRFDAGSAPKYDVIRAQTELVNAEQTLITSQNAGRLAEAQLASVLGMRLPPDMQLTAPSTGDRDLPPMEDVMARALTARPEAVADKAAELAADRGILIARRGLKPGMRVDGNLNWNGTTTQLNSRQFSADLMLSVSVPVFDSGVTKGRVEQARAAAGSAKAASAQTQLTIRLEVEQAYVSIENARKRLDSARAVVGQAEEGMRLARVRYENGVSAPIEVTDAQLALTVAQTKLVDSRHDLLLAYARLARAAADDSFAVHQN